VQNEIVCHHPDSLSVTAPAMLELGYWTIEAVGLARPPRSTHGQRHKYRHPEREPAPYRLPSLNEPLNGSDSRSRRVQLARPESRGSGRCDACMGLDVLTRAWVRTDGLIRNTLVLPAFILREHGQPVMMIQTLIRCTATTTKQVDWLVLIVRRTLTQKNIVSCISDIEVHKKRSSRRRFEHRTSATVADDFRRTHSLILHTCHCTTDHRWRCHARHRI